MSLIRRSRVIVNGVQRMRTHHYYWCLQCQRTVRIPSAIIDPSEMLCPHCLNQLRHEIDVSRPRLAVATTGLQEPPAAAQLLDVLTQMLQNPNSFNHSTRTNSENQNPNSNRRGWIILQFLNPTHRRPPPMISPPENPLSPLTDPIQSNNDGGLEDFIQQLAQIDRPGPPAAPMSAIDSLATVNLTQAHLENDSVCPICKEEFEVGGEVRVLPCKHFYHSDCVVPWLRIHNSCPVCRFELQGDFSDDCGSGSEGFLGGGEELRNGLRWLWNWVLGLWPFRLLWNWNVYRDNGGLNFQDDGIYAPDGGENSLFYHFTLFLFLFLFLIS
ncbi:E3 ubiquitin-protein ligase RZF1 isoform X1 [Rhododendron vialii]|uniref:E3 ubiquitin-protein ligase RZF1 isoform X1 n=1 Tax=Rhododendron vialii TaxID=182163 RepID=UPI00266046EF|nr:E3 ubiquitin-protein ligase RZF1 isoform X1 [Rhododendron vialii]